MHVHLTERHGTAKTRAKPRQKLDKGNGIAKIGAHHIRNLMKVKHACLILLLHAPPERSLWTKDAWNRELDALLYTHLEQRHVWRRTRLNSTDKSWVTTLSMAYNAPQTLHTCMHATVIANLSNYACHKAAKSGCSDSIQSVPLKWGPQIGACSTNLQATSSLYHNSLWRAAHMHVGVVFFQEGGVPLECRPLRFQRASPFEMKPLPQFTQPKVAPLIIQKPLLFKSQEIDLPKWSRISNPLLLPKWSRSAPLWSHSSNLLKWSCSSNLLKWKQWSWQVPLERFH